VCVRVTCKDNGVELELVTFQGDAETNQALLGGAVDFNVQALAGMMNLLKTGKEVRAFYGGMNTADFAWVAQPGIKSWADLKGKRIGVTTFGSLTDSLTRQALTQQGLEPEKDVQIIQAGGSPTSWPTIKAGALDAGILSINFWLQAEEQGFTILGKQKDEIAPTWPKEVFVAPVEFIDANPNTITAILRGFSAAVELIHKDKKLATSVLSEELKYKPERADKVYDAISSSFHADGRMAKEAMPVFWKVMQTNKVVDGPLDPEKWLVTDWLDTYDEWVKK
jgi:NitT/TauT family transport system substrate-binding protein